MDKPTTGKELKEQVLGIKENAKRVLAMMKDQYLGDEAGYNVKTLECVEEHLINAIHHFSDEQKEEVKTAVLSNCACFLGQCLIENLGGEWRLPENENWSIYFDEGNMAFPFSKVWKNYENGSEDSISTMLKALKVMRENGNAVPAWNYNCELFRPDQTATIKNASKLFEDFNNFKEILNPCLNTKNKLIVSITEKLDGRDISLAIDYVQDDTENTKLCLNYNISFEEVENERNYTRSFDYPPKQKDLDYIYDVYFKFFKGVLPDVSEFINISQGNDDIEERVSAELAEHKNKSMEEMNIEYTIYDDQGNNIEECVPISSFDVVVDKLFECLEKANTISFSTEDLVGAFLPTIQVVPTENEEGEPVIMLTFETNPQDSRTEGETYAKFYDCPIKEEDLKDICSYLHGFCIDKMLPNVTNNGWEDLTEREEDNQPEIVAYYTDEDDHPVCKDSEDTYYWMHKGNSFDEFGFMYSSELEIDPSKLGEVNDTDAKIRAEYVYNLGGSLYTFWINDGTPYAVDYNSIVCNVDYNENGLALSTAEGIEFSFAWESATVERVIEVLKNGD